MDYVFDSGDTSGLEKSQRFCYHWLGSVHIHAIQIDRKIAYLNKFTRLNCFYKKSPKNQISESEISNDPSPPY